MKLQCLPVEKVRELAFDEDVSSDDVIKVLDTIEGLTFDEAWAYADELAHRRSWNMATRLAVFDGIDLAREALVGRTYH